jgi:hypothetical protein
LFSPTVAMIFLVFFSLLHSLFLGRRVKIDDTSAKAKETLAKSTI